MALTHAFQEAVSDGNVRKIRIMLKDSLLVDPTFERFKEMERAASSVEGLYDEHDGRSFTEDPDEWDDLYMDKIMVQVVGNFSHERVDHLKAVVRKLRPVKRKVGSDLKKTSQNSLSPNDGSVVSYREQKKKDQENGDYKYAIIGGGAVVGGIVGCVGGTVASLSVVGCTIGGAVIGAAAGGAVVYLTGERK